MCFYMHFIYIYIYIYIYIVLQYLHFNNQEELEPLKDVFFILKDKN